MDISPFLYSDLFVWIVMPVLIFLATICDVSLGTIRVIFVGRGFRQLAAAIGFVEVVIWLLAISQIMRNLDNLAYYLANGAGFALGIYVGMLIEDKLSIGKVIVRVFVKENETGLLDYLRTAHFGATTLDARGAYGPVKVILSVVDRRDLGSVIDRIGALDPHAFYSIENVKQVNEGVFPPREIGPVSGRLGFLRQAFRTRK